MSWPGMSLPFAASAAPRPSLGPCEERRLISLSWRPRQHPRRWNMGRMRGRQAGTRLSAGPPGEGGYMPWGRTRDDTEVDLCRRPDDWARLEPKDVGRAGVVRESLLHHLARAEANTWGDRRRRASVASPNGPRRGETTYTQPNMKSAMMLDFSSNGRWSLRICPALRRYSAGALALRTGRWAHRRE